MMLFFILKKFVTFYQNLESYVWQVNNRRRKMFKKLICSVLSVVLIMSVGVTVSAENATPISVQPRLTYIMNCESDLTISGSQAKYSCDVSSYPEVTKIVVEMELQKKIIAWWSEVETTTVTVWDNTLYHQESCSLTSSGKYRNKVTITAYSGSASEELTITSAEKTY